MDLLIIRISVIVLNILISKIFSVSFIIKINHINKYYWKENIYVCMSDLYVYK